ncbi:hypothetical protein FSP39_010810 [Pinctada imbricata]|uniref:Uncharacterized protein n=1 Tax=Pinctada imbricata TaxID=66713 RepID=A0AA89C568_PINIB|nr:hypothetical protein FSP39_010810 [Pinctada imbricata]
MKQNQTQKHAIEICNQNLSSGDLFTNACDQEFAANSLLGNCTDILTCSDDNLKDIDFKCLSCSDTETSEDYWSVSGDDNSELEKWDQNDYSEAMEYLVLSNPRSLTPTSVDFEGDRGLIPDDEVKQLNDNVCNNIYQEQRNILSEKQLCIKETSLRNDTKLQNLETQEPEVISSGLADDKVLQATSNNDIHCLSETFCNNNVPFDIKQGNIRPSSKCKSIRENSESNSALVCRKDKEQYGSEDIKEERFLEQANSVEYFDENVDKSDALINEVSEGAIDPKLRGNYFREWGDVLTVGSGDNMSHLSMKNIMTHSNSGDGVCYISDSFTDSRLGSSLLNVDSNRNEISNCASVNEHQNVGLITNLEENNLDQIDTTNLPTSRHDTELKESEKEINSKDTEYSCVTTLQSTVDAGSSEEPRGSNFGLDEESDYSEKENDDFCSLSSGDEIADYNTHADANMNDMCIKKEVSGEDSRKITRHRRVITRRERSIKYETVTTKIPKEVHGEKNALPVTTSSVSLLTQNADDGTSRVVQTTIQRSVTSSKNITSTITSQYSHALSGENIQTGKWMSSSLLSANVKDHSESLSTGLAILNQEKLLSEIVELEDNVRDASPRSTLSNNRGLSLDPCGTPSTADENKKNFNRSQSLPTTSLNGFGQPRIVYKDGHFVIETGLDDHLESEDHVDENNIDDKENMCETGQHSVKASPKEETTRSNRKARALAKRRSNSEADLLDKGPLDDDSDLDVFLNNDGEVTVIEGGDGERSPYWHVLVKRRTKPLNDHSDAESSSSRPLSIDESQLQMSVDDLSRRPEVTKSRKADNIKRRSASFKELRSFKLKRNSSFREAQERGALLRNSGKNDSVGNLSLSPSEMSIGSETRFKGSGILNRMFRRNKSFNEKGSNAANESLFEHKRDLSREPPKNRKMSLKSLFGGKKTKSDSSQSVSSDEPPTPPIAVFQSDLDIHAVDSAPNSPYASQKFHRRYTAADLYEQRAHTLPRRPSDTSKPQNLTISKDHLSVKSLDIQNLANHPKRPISPKPVGLHIPRRNSNVSLPISSNRDVMNDVRGRSSLGNRLDYCDSVSVSSGNSAQTDVTPTSPPLASDD